MNANTAEETVKPQAPSVTAEAAASDATVSSELPNIRYASDEEVREAMTKIFEWHAPLLAKLAQ